jgi:hypothetical protein
MIAETMSLQQLEHLALTRGLILPEFIKEEWDATQIAGNIIKLLEQNWNISN